MKRLCLFLTAIAVLCSANVWAAKSVDEFYEDIRTDNNVDLSAIDEKSSVLLEITDRFTLRKGLPATRYMVWMPSVNSDTYYTAVFEDGTYKGTYKDFVWTAPLKFFDKDKANAYAEEYGLGVPSEVRAYYITEGVHLHAYSIICDGEEYIIPYYFMEYSEFNIMKDDECNLEIGKVYSIEEFLSICEKEAELSAKYRWEKEKEEDSKKTYIVVDENGDGNDVLHEPAQPKDKSEDSDVPENSGNEVPVGKKEEESDETEQKTGDNKSDQEETKRKEDKPKAIQFDDVPQTHWAYNAVAELAESGIIQGYGDGNFGVDDFVTYEQIALLLKREFNYIENNKEMIAASREDVIVSLVKSLAADIADADDSVIFAKFTDG